jgi:uncharacterized protein (TIGR03435 family)
MIGKNEPKLKQVQPDDRTSTSVGRGRVAAKRISMGDFATLLSSLLERPVRDMTQLEGMFDVMLEWIPDENPSATGRNGEPAAIRVDKASGPSILQEQLGLKLQSQKNSTEFLIIDHAEKPLEN